MSYEVYKITKVTERWREYSRKFVWLHNSSKTEQLLNALKIILERIVTGVAMVLYGAG